MVRNTTIQFYCPNCDAVIAFDSKHIGKQAHCTSCGQRFIIPAKSFDKPKKIKPQIEKGEPLPGFYRAVFIDSWKIFDCRADVAGLAFIAAVACFKFLVRDMNYSIVFFSPQFVPGPPITLHLPLPFGIVMTIVAWGCLFWYYMRLIYSTAFGDDQLPDFHSVSINKFLSSLPKTIYTLFIVLLVLGLPYIIAFLIIRKTGPCPVVLQALMFGGLFLFPSAMLIVAIGRDLTMLSPGYLLKPIFRAPSPYLITAALSVAAAALEMQTTPYKHAAFSVTAGQLAMNLAVQVIAIIAMRSVGLFYRHYSCHLPW